MIADDACLLRLGNRIMLALCVMLQTTRQLRGGPPATGVIGPDEIEAVRLYVALLPTEAVCPITGAVLGVDLSRATNVAASIGVPFGADTDAELRAMDFGYIVATTAP